MAWDSGRDTELTKLVERVVAGDPAAWRALMVAIAPPIEGWAKGNRVLRRCRLTSDDDARAVMVDVLERLAADSHANLKQFLARAAAAPDVPDLVDEVVRLGRLDDDAEPERDDDRDTPLRAWLIRLVDFTSRDHVRHRLGWGTDDKRKVGSGAASLSEVPERGARPPMTDKLSMSKFVAEVRDYMATFPPEMRDAVVLWLDEVEADEIAARLALADAAKARALVRAGQARLREKFRGRSPLLFA